MKNLQTFISESQMEDSYGNLPWAYELGDGTYHGIASGYSIDINGKTYRMPFGIRGIKCPINIKVEGQNITHS